MSENIDNLLLEHLKKIQAEQTAARERDAEIIRRLSNLEGGQGSIIQHLGNLAAADASQQMSIAH